MESVSTRGRPTEPFVCVVAIAEPDSAAPPRGTPRETSHGKSGRQSPGRIGLGHGPRPNVYFRSRPPQERLAMRLLRLVAAVIVTALAAVPAGPALATETTVVMPGAMNQTDP